MVVRQAISVGRSLRWAAASASRIAAASWPSMRQRLPAGGRKRASWSAESDKRGRAVDRDVVVVEEHDQLVQLQMAGERVASWLTPSIRSPSPAMHIGVVVDQRRRTAREHPLGQRHADGRGDALPERAGGRFDAGVWPYSGWPAQGLPSWRKVRMSSMRHGLHSRSDQQGVKQHRAVAGRQHEAVAVGPVRGRRRRISGSRGTARSRRRPCPSACRDGRIWPPRPHPWRARGSRWPGVSCRPGCSRATLRPGWSSIRSRKKRWRP